MQTQSITPRTITAKSGMILPATIDQQTDFNLIATAMTIYYKHSGCLGSFDTAVKVSDAMRDGSAVVVLYVGLDGGRMRGYSGRTASVSPQRTRSSRAAMARCASSGRPFALIAC